MLAGVGPAQAGTARLILPQSATTSAGIFDADDRLVRTLWSGEHREKGRVSIDWDGHNDEGQLVPRNGRYVARVLAHNVRYMWEGVIGNTSREQVGAHLYRGFLPIGDMAFDDRGDGFYAMGYNERQPAMHRFRISDPQSQDALAHEDYRRVFRYVATDGVLAYFANIGLAASRGNPARDAETFVVALNVNDGQEHIFPAGRRAGTDPGTIWQSAVDYEADDMDFEGRFRLAATGLAVQRRGKDLFVAHAPLDEIRILDKRSGELLGRIAAPRASALGVAPDDSLWVLCREQDGAVVRHFRPSGSDWLADIAISRGLVAPVALGVSPVDGSVLIVDAATEQVKAFDSDGRALWTLGREGGYRTGGPHVVDDKFSFSTEQSYVAFQADGSFWLGDPGNKRNLHFSADRRYLGEIMYLPRSYVVAVDANDPTRVFCHFLEFKVDYSLPIERSWRLVRNWSAGMDRRYRGDFEGLQAVFTLRNGRTYGVVRRFDIGRNEVVELTALGLRPTGMKLDFNTKLYADGSLRMHLIRFDSLQVFIRRLKDFDREGNPIWSEPALLAKVEHLSKRDPYYHDVPFIPGINEASYPQTDRGIVISFNPGDSDGFHLGGIEPGRDEWLWRASPAGGWDVDGQGQLTPKDGRYDIGHGVQYPGNVVLAVGRNVIFGYHGEMWRSGEANQWLHFYDDGLFIGQFGKPGVYGPWSPPEIALPGQSGNAFSAQLIRFHGRLYLWHNDESGHGGVHRWRIVGAERIRLFDAPIRP